MGLSVSTSTVFKFGITAAVLLLSADLAFVLYERQKKRLENREINEVFFLMSNSLPCCHNSETVDSKLRECINPHCKGKLSNKIIEHIDSAKHLICIAMYMNCMNQITSALLRAHKRGIKLRIITDQSMIASSNSKINQLQNAGVAVRVAGDGERYMHNKFCLIDVMLNENDPPENLHPTGGLVINGSLNWTSNGFSRNWENVTFQSNEYMKNEYKKAFDYIWKRLAPRKKDLTK